MTRPVDTALKKYAVITKKLRALSFDGLPGVTQRRHVLTAHQTNAAPACGGFQHQRESHLRRPLAGLFQGLQQPGARGHRQACLSGQGAGAVLLTKVSNLRSVRADKHDPRHFAGSSKLCPLRKKTVSGENRLCAALFCRGENFINIQISISGAVAAQRDGVCGVGDMRRVAVAVRINRDAFNPHPLKGADSPAGDFATVSNQYTLKHGDLLRRCDDGQARLSSRPIA